MHTTTSFSPVSPRTGALRPLGIDRVRIDGGFWGDRQQLNADAIIPHCLHWETREGWIANFAHTVAGTIAGNRHGREFSDSDVYKLIEAMAWEVGRTGNPELNAQIERLGTEIEAAQYEDGYLNTKFGNPGQDGRYTDFAWGHELYNFGHLFQAATARIRTGYGTSSIVRIGLRAADHVVAEFWDREEVCGHPEIEVALAELSRTTGDNRYLELARRLIERRGHGLLPAIEFGQAYFQDDEPFRDSTVLRGHAVRALYLCAAAVDVAVDTDDAELLEAARLQFVTTLARRTYLTGGMGSHHQDEAFGEDFELPPDRSYCETCAGVGAVMVAWRLLLATGDLSYGDIIERVLYNVIAASPAEDGRSFFYSNPLHRRTPGSPPKKDEASLRVDSSLRAPWFKVSCCPTNVARTVASLSHYVAASTDDAIALMQYVPGSVRVAGPDGDVELTIATQYPHDGRVRIEVATAPTPFALRLRIPSWATGATVNGAATAPGEHRLEGLSSGDTVELVLPLSPRFSLPDERIDAVRGTVAVERGPLVLCAESVDLPEGMSVNEFGVDPSSPLIPSGTGARLRAQGLRLQDSAWPYAPDKALDIAAEFDLHLIPYHRWGNRGPATMRVWLPVSAAAG